MNKETYSLVTKIIAVLSSCRTRQQVKVARRYVALACKQCPDLSRDYYLRALNKIDTQLLNDSRPRLILSRHARKMPMIINGGDSHADQ